MVNSNGSRKEDMNISSSFDNNSILDYKDFHIDLHDLLDENSSIPNIQDELQKPSNGSENLIERNSSPKKISSINKSNSFLGISSNGLFSSRISLEPSMNDSNLQFNDLFEVTSTLRRSPQKKSFKFPMNYVSHYQEDEDDINDEDDDDNGDFGFITGERLNNDKINKLVDGLGMKYSKEKFDFELDDQLRTRFYKGRFNRGQMREDGNDDLDIHLEDYLKNIPKSSQNENKENIPVLGNSSAKGKISKGIVRSKRKTELKNKGKIPVLKPLSNLTNLELQKVAEFSVKKDLAFKSTPCPKGKCTPNKSNAMPIKSCIKATPHNKHIYIVDSSTGLINDATQFGTELNASNCEGFPLPEDFNEIVQIPTNDDSGAKKQKMAIIKLFANKSFSSNISNKHLLSPRLGFYSKKELERYNTSNQRESMTGVSVINQSTLASSNNRDSSKSKIKWADELEW